MWKTVPFQIIKFSISMQLVNVSTVGCLVGCVDMVKKGNIKRETEFLLIVAQNNAIRTNSVEAKFDNTQ